jgi:ubiquinone/menaquinone biosynthesis C-methylase UbiE
MPEPRSPILVGLLGRCLQVAYHLLYYQLAWTYDLVAWLVSGGEWADWRHCVFPFLRPGRILEAAHGTGTLALELAARGYHVVAFDLSPAMSQIASGKRKAALRKKAAGVHPHNPFLIRGNIYSLPLRTGSFSSVVSTFPADFVVDQRAMQEIHRVLEPGGRWIILPAAYPIWFERLRSKQHAVDPTPTILPSIQRRMQGIGLRMRIEKIRRRRSIVVVWIVEKD